MQKLLVCCALFFLSLQVSGQIQVVENPYLKFDRLDEQTELSNSNVLALLQTTDGYLWFGTVNGLYQYDGFRSIAVNTCPDPINYPGCQLISCLAETNQHKLLVGTSNGLFIYNSLQKSFSPIKGFEPTSNAGKQSFIRAIATDTSSIIWIETADGKLNSFDFSTQQSESYQHGAPSMINTYFYHSILLDEEEGIWLGGRYMGIIHFDRKTKTFSTIKAKTDDPNSKRDEDIAFHFKDSNGVIWIGGIDGLYTFNPKTDVFTKKLAVSSFSMVEENNNLWVGTGNGIYMLNQNLELFQHIHHDDNNPLSLNSDHIHKLLKDKSGNIWIGTQDGISIFRPSKNKFKHIYHIPGNDQTPVSNHISAILVDNQDRIWVGTDNQGLECFNSNWEKLFSYSSQKSGPFQLRSNRISTLMQDKEGDIWVGQWSGKGFNTINPDKQKNLSWSLLEGEMKADWYSDFLQDKEGNYWMAIWGAQGLYQFDKTKQELQPDRYALLSAANNRAVKKVLFDGEFLWLAFSNQKRLVAYDPEHNRYRFYSLDHYNHFDFTKIIDIQQKDANIQFTTNTKTYILDKENNFKIRSTGQKTNRIIKTLPTIEGYKTYDSFTAPNGSQWYATNKGLLHIQKDKKHVEYHIPNTDIQCDTIYSLSFDFPDKIWLGTANSFCYFSISKKEFTPVFVPDTAFLSSRLTRFLYEDSQGLLWIGTTNKGLMSLDRDNVQFSHYDNNPSDSSAFWGTAANCMIEDRSGRIWLGGYGLNRFHPINQTFSHTTTENGLADNTIMAILEDQYGDLWISSQNGLTHFKPKDNSIFNYSDKDGLQHNQFSSAAGKLPDGRLLFGGKNGINIIDPGHVPNNENPPAVVLTDFQVFDESHAEYLKESNALELTYRQNYFSFEFAALDFSDPQANSYAYQLENFDDNWVYTGADRPFARYTNVEPGHYVFKVKAANSDGIWNHQGLTVPVFIAPPFWKTTWFYALIVLLFAFLLILYIKYREKKIKEQNRLLILEQKLLRSQMNPHFIFNSLSSIQSFIFDNNPITAGSYLSRFAELIRSILYNSREEFISLEREIKTLNNYLSLQQLRYNNNFDFEIKVDENIDPEDLLIPPMLAQPFIENAIEHGIKHIQHRGQISIGFTIKTGQLMFTVEDNGIGIEAAKNLKNAKAKEHQSLATIITRERIEILNRSDKNKPYIMHIEELKNSSHEVKGTQIRFLMPLIQP